MKPIVVHPRMDFMMYAMDPIVNQAAKWSYMFGGQSSPSITIRGIINRGGNGAKDTLTMTEIEFFNTGEYMVTQWWFLPPPHLKSGLNSTQVINPYPQLSLIHI